MRWSEDQVYWKYALSGVLPALTQDQYPQAVPPPWATLLLRLFGP